VFLAGTGCRVGEAVAVKWDAVDLEAGTVSIRANVVRAHGRGIILQDHPKAKAGVRTIAMPAAIVGLLGDRLIKGVRRSHNLVFPTALGNLRDPRNTSRDWSLVRVRLG
jgi:integrase